MGGEGARMDGRLRARPGRVTGAAPGGLQPLMLGVARYREFDGGHTIPPEVTSEAVGWFMQSRLS